MPSTIINSRGADGYRPVGAVVNGVVVDRTLDAVPCAKLLEILDEYIGVEGIRVVIVELCPLFVGHIVVRLVIVVVIDHGNVPAEALDKLFGDGGLAAAGASGYADYHYIHDFILSPFSVAFSFDLF